jgi:hypothetical protein
MYGSGWNFAITEADQRQAIEQAGLDVLQYQPPPAKNPQAWFVLAKPDN